MPLRIDRGQSLLHNKYPFFFYIHIVLFSSFYFIFLLEIDRTFGAAWPGFLSACANVSPHLPHFLSLLFTILLALPPLFVPPSSFFFLSRPSQGKTFIRGLSRTETAKVVAAV